jgi:hypothetical protein
MSVKSFTTDIATDVLRLLSTRGIALDDKTIEDLLLLIMTQVALHADDLDDDDQPEDDLPQGYKGYLQRAATAIDHQLPDGHGFILLTFPFGGTPENNVVQYASNAERGDAVLAVKEWLFRMGVNEEWMKHVR